MRRKAKTDLFFLTTTILGYDKLSPNLHGHVATWMKKTRNWQYRLMLLPRSHFKSTINTIGDTIQTVLPDDDFNSPYPYNLGPDCRVVIAHEAQEHASRFLASITQHVRHNPMLIALYPTIIPTKDCRMNKTELDLPRNRFWNEPTIDVIGVGTKSQGRHYNKGKIDDIYGTEARDSEAVHKTTISWINNLQSLLITPDTDILDFVGTRYKHNDAYTHIMETYEDELIKYIRPILEVDPKTGKKEPIFPEQFSHRSIKILRKDPVVFNSQYLNDPLQGDSEFDVEWERYYSRIAWESRDNRRVSYEDSSGDIKTHKLQELDRLIIVDPAPKGKTGIVVTGTNSERLFKCFLLDVYEEAFTTPKFVSKLFELVRRWRPRAVIIEEVNFSSLYAEFLPLEMANRQEYFRILPAKTKQKQKEDRVRGLTNYFSSGQIYMHPSQEDFIDTLRKFPNGKDYHALDALAYGPENWRSSHHNSEEEEEKRKDAVAEMMRLRDPITGYSKIRGSKIFVPSNYASGKGR